MSQKITKKRKAEKRTWKIVSIVVIVVIAAGMIVWGYRALNPVPGDTPEPGDISEPGDNGDTFETIITTADQGGMQYWMFNTPSIKLSRDGSTLIGTVTGPPPYTCILMYRDYSQVLTLNQNSSIEMDLAIDGTIDWSRVIIGQDNVIRGVYSLSLVDNAFKGTIEIEKSIDFNWIQIELPGLSRETVVTLARFDVIDRTPA
jgi:hypothetical protein